MKYNKFVFVWDWLKSYCSVIVVEDGGGVWLECVFDVSCYYVDLCWQGVGKFMKVGVYDFCLCVVNGVEGDMFVFICLFLVDWLVDVQVIMFDDVCIVSVQGWKEYWM